MKTKQIIAAILVVTMTGCATYRPVVDPGRNNMANYDQDLAQCQALGEQKNAAEHAAAGAGIGAIFGALLGAAIGGNRQQAQYGAGIGAVQGGGAGMMGAAIEQRKIIANCMRGRGYTVLD